MSDRKAEFRKVMKELRDCYNSLIYFRKATMKDYRAERHRLIRKFRKEKMIEQFKLWIERKQNTIYVRKRDRKAQDKLDMEKIKSLDKFVGDS